MNSIFKVMLCEKRDRDLVIDGDYIATLGQKLQVTRAGLAINPLQAYNPISLSVFSNDVLVSIQQTEMI